MLSVELRLFSDQALNVFRGRRASQAVPEIIGAKKYNNKMKYVYGVALQGCPFAAATIHQTEQGFDALHATMEAQLRALKIQYPFLHLTDPKAVVKVRGFNATGLAACRCIAVYDEVVFYLHFARRRGAIEKNRCFRTCNQYRKNIRTLMYLGCAYKDYQFRTDVDRSSHEWQQAVKHFGDPEAGYRAFQQRRKLSPNPELTPHQLGSLSK